MSEQRQHDLAVMAALADNGELTPVGLQGETGLDSGALDAALYRLTGRGCVRRLPGDRYKAVDARHSKAVRRGLFVRQIPKLCAYLAPAYPVVEQVARLGGAAL